MWFPKFPEFSFTIFFFHRMRKQFKGMSKLMKAYALFHYMSFLAKIGSEVYIIFLMSYTSSDRILFDVN